MNRRELRQQTAEAVEDLIVVSQSTGGTTAYIEDTALSGSLNIVGCFVNIEVSGMNYEREVISYDSENHQIVVHPAFPTAVVDGCPYEVLRIPKAYFDRKINDAIRSTRERLLLDVKDDTLKVTAGVLEYSIPTTVDFIIELWLESTAGVFVIPIPRALWKVIPGRLLEISTAISGYVDKHIRIIGQRFHPELSADNVACLLDSNYIIAHCAYHILAEAEGRSPEVGRAAVIYTYLGEATNRLQEIARPAKPDSVRV